MWTKLIAKLSAKKVIAIVSAVAVIILAVVAVPLIAGQKELPVDGTHVEQPADESLEIPNESLEEETPVEEDEPTDEDEPTGEDEPTDEDEPDGAEEPGDKESLWDKIVGVITDKDSNKGPDKDSDKEASDTPSVNPNVPVKTFTVKFFTDGGTEFAPENVMPGTKISSLKTPYKENCIFEGWYYDKAGTRPVASTDTVTKNLSLYASYLQMSPLEAIESKKFASATDVAGDFCVLVEADDPSIDAAAVLSGIEATNLSNPDQKDFVKVTGGNGSFVVTGAAGENTGFEEGASFRIALKDGRLNFKDEPDTVREYNFTTAKEEVLNLQYNDDIVYIPLADLSEIIVNGQQVDSLNIPLYSVSTADDSEPADLDKGTFVYSKGTLSVGDIVTVYAGVRPDLRTVDTPFEDCGEVAYVEITAKNGNTYSYQKAEAEDILFEPDMLPIPVDADTDARENTVTVENKYLDYSADVYANIELDSQTTVDPGDYLVFYTGTFGINSGANAVALTGVYGEVVRAVDNGDGTTTITYIKADWETVSAAMDVYSNETLSGAYLIEGVDTAALEAQIEQQAIDSGFAEEAAQYLASLALATDNFTRLSENMNLEDYKVTLSDGSPVSPEELQLMDSSVKAEFKLEKLKPKIGIRPSHLGDAEDSAAANQGLVVELEVEGTLTISKKGTDNTIEITIGGTFVEEIGIDIGASHKAIWDTWGPFPYISDYRVTANVDLLNYTGIEVNATMVTKEADDEGDDEGDDDEEGESIADYIKKLLEAAQEEGEDEEEEDEDEDGSNLVKHYSEMLEEEADFLKIVDAQMFEKKIYCSSNMPIICIELQADFIVEMEACVSIGFDFEYKTGKRYVFNIDVFGLSATSDTITLIEETYEFSFYAMGRLGVRAGVEFTFKIGLFDTSTNSIGLQVGAGAYTKLWGYFYYELNYSASQGREQSYNGAMLIEVGAFLEMGINAQVLEGLLSKEYEILDMEWLLWHVGSAENILDFTTPQEDMPNVKLKQYIRSTMLPDSTFLLHYLDLQEGEEVDAIYEDYFDESKPVSEENRKNFTITFTNDKFSYDPQTNAVIVTPAAGDEKLEGEMIITWNHYPLAFSSKPIQRTISLYWDNLRDGYVIVPYTNGGTYIPIIEAKFEESVAAPANPERLGYNFAGWYSDEAFENAYTFPESMPAADASIYAKWDARTDTPYRVEHYQQQLASGEYELFETEEFTGTTNAYVSPAVKTYVGYDSPAVQELKILADGSAVLRYYYDLKWASVTFAPGEIGGTPVTYELKYGARIAAPQMAEKGYTFTGWDKEVVPTMGTVDVTYTAQWVKNPDTEYRIEYYVQAVDGRYILQHMIEDEGFTGDTFTAAQLRALIVDEENGLTADEKYIAANAFEFDKMTVGGMVCDTAEIAGNGKTVIKINYKRALHTVTFDYGYDEKSVTNDICYEGVIPVLTAERTGYAFKGWSLDGVTVTAPQEKVGLEDLTYIAVWAPNTYTVKFDKNSETATGTMENLAFVYDEEQALTANAFHRDNYKFAGWGEHTDGAVKYADGEKVLNLTAENGAVVTLYAHWTPEVFDIRYHGCEGTANTNPVTYTVESAAITLLAPVKEGYVFKGWYKDAAFTGAAVTSIQTGSAGDLDLYAKWEARSDIPYRVEHYQETAEGSWVLADADTLTGSIDKAITPAVKHYNYYKAPTGQLVYIAVDGSTVVRYEYERKSYTITLDAGIGALPEGAKNTVTAKHGTAISLPSPQKAGYGFDGWYNGNVLFTDNVMPTGDVTLTAKYTEGQYGYTVNHYQQNVTGTGYTVVESVTGTAPMDATLTPVINNYTGFTSPDAAKTIVIGTNAAQNVVDYYYTRNQYDLSWNLNGGTAEGYTTGKVYYGAAIAVPAPVKTGYTYNWDKTPATVMPAKDLAYTANWSANTYAVVFNLDGGSVVSGSAETRTVTFDAAYGEMPVVKKSGYLFDGWYTAKEGGSRITADTLVTTAGDHTLYARYTAVTYTITYNGVEGAANENPTSYGVATGNITLNKPVKEGFTFEGWYAEEDFSGEPVNTIAADSGKNLTLFAKWQENSYTVIFHANNGSGESTAQETFTYTEEKALDKNAFVRGGYVFLGWATGNTATEPEYTDEQVVSMLTAKANGEIHLYAVWACESFDIVYENLDGAVNAPDNPVKFSADNNVITLNDPSKTGYTFEGWYTDPAFENEVSGSITLDAYHTWIFYAKWRANEYVVVFDSLLGDTVPRETMLLTYDQAANLTLIEEMSRFSNPGYTFRGWSSVKNGEVVYADGQNVINLAASGSVNLYAVWELNVFEINYTLGVGGESHTNPASYSFEDDDIVLAAPAAKAGYQFLGWYEDDTRVTEIVKGEQKDFDLTAKWAHGGFFSVKYTGSENADDGINRIFTVTRTIPEGAEATTNPQYVYYRTLNYTAYGSTVDVEQGGQHDKYHFLHVGGPDVFMVFAQNDTEMTFKVKEWGSETLGDLAAAFMNQNGFQRSYFVELYDVIDTVGGCEGSIDGENKKVQMTIDPLADGLGILSGLPYVWYGRTLELNEVKITDDGWSENVDYTVDIGSYIKGKLEGNDYLLNYLKQTSDGVGFYVSFDIYELHDGYQWMRFTDLNTDSRLAEISWETKHGDDDETWRNGMVLPTNGSNQFDGIVKFPQNKDHPNTNNWTIGSAEVNGSSIYYGTVDASSRVLIEFDASGSSGDDWHFRNLGAHFNVLDTTAPQQVGVAPMAFGTYHKGDTVYITVNYDEVIDDAWSPFAFLGNIEGVYVTDATCLGSYGSNALVFEAIVSEDFEITPDANNVLVNTKPVVATVWDVLGNGYE